MPGLHLRRNAVHFAISALLAALAIAVAPVGAGADVSGKWHFRIPALPIPIPGLSTGIVDVAQSGTSVSFSLAGLSFSGTLSGNRLSMSAPATEGWPCGASIQALLSPDEKLMRALLITTLSPPCNVPGVIQIDAQRCGCFDGNSSNGDGCDDACQVEPCFTCTGEPSICIPSGDGAPCDDGLVCTSGESCSSGVCGGGAPVNPCVDLTGAWLFHYLIPDLLLESEAQMHLKQTNNFLELRPQTNGPLFFAGTIDPVTGDFDLVGMAQYVYDLLCPEDTFSGQAAADGRSLAGNLVNYVRTPTQCSIFTVNVSGSRCGGGTIDPGEECDDGNGAAGDGCDASCRIEACHTCAGEPSQCAPQDGTPCDDHNDCTAADACHAGVCTGVPQPDGTPCDDGDACTAGDTCQGGQCVASDPLLCAPCLTCNEGQCVPAPRAGCFRSVSPATTLTLRNASSPEKDIVVWRWRRGEGTALADLGDPSQSIAYALCIYDESGPSPALVFSALAEQRRAAGSRRGAACRTRAETEPSMGSPGSISAAATWAAPTYWSRARVPSCLPPRPGCRRLRYRCRSGFNCSACNRPAPLRPASSRASPARAWSATPPGSSEVARWTLREVAGQA